MMTTRTLVAFTLLGSVVSSSMQQPLEPLIKFRSFQESDTWTGEREVIFIVCVSGQTHRKTTDGRLCAGAYVHNSQAYTVSQ